MRFDRMVAVSVLALSVACAGVAQAETYTDNESGFSIEFPEGWAVQKQTGDMKVMANSRNKKLAGVSCNVAETVNPNSKTMTQAQIDGALAATFAEDWWRKNVFNKHTNVTFEKIGSGPHPSGRASQFAIGAGDFVYGENTLKVKQWVVLMMTPGKTHLVTCVSLQSDFEKMRPDFEHTLASFRPL